MNTKVTLLVFLGLAWLLPVAASVSDGLGWGSELAVPSRCSLNPESPALRVALVLGFYGELAGGDRAGDHSGPEAQLRKELACLKKFCRSKDAVVCSRLAFAALPASTERAFHVGRRIAALFLKSGRRNHQKAVLRVLEHLDETSLGQPLPGSRKAGKRTPPSAGRQVRSDPAELVVPKGSIHGSSKSLFVGSGSPRKPSMTDAKREPGRQRARFSLDHAAELFLASTPALASRAVGLVLRSSVNSDGHFALGRALMRAGGSDVLAAGHFALAAELSRETALFNVAAGNAYCRLGRRAEARRYWARAQLLEPWNGYRARALSRTCARP